MRKYFVCSVGQPGEDYVEDNFSRITSKSTFFMHEGTTQKGLYNEMEVNDILILKYNSNYVAYGESLGNKIIESEDGWCLTTPVKEWYYFDENNQKRGVNSNGIQWETISGSGQMATVKGITPEFGLKKIREISNKNELYKLVSEEIRLENMKYITTLLKYKKQIILQGPPGTGKTRLAKKIADKLINNNPQNLSPKEMIENFFKAGRSDLKYNESFRNRLEEFYEYFPKNQFSKIELNDYCIGRSNSTNFCWWIERGLDKYGKFTPGNSGNYVVYYSKEDEDYRLAKFSEKGLSDIFIDIQKALSDLVENEDILNASKLFGDSFIIKILNSYYPEKYFPINGRTSLINLMKIFDKPFKKIATIELNKTVQDIFSDYKNKYPSAITTLDFMHFLYSKFDLKNDGNLYEESSEINISRKPTLIQFHPSYTYEDFVKGIVAMPSERGIIYKAEDKTLIKLANDAREYSGNNYVLIIDEINRANLSSVLGELIYALEYRGEEVESMYEVDGSQKLILPPNLYIIGTMNTADRSVGHIDYAIRRRFAFVDILPKNLTTELGSDFKKDIFTKVSELFIENYNPEIGYGPEESRLNRSQHLSEEFEPKDVWLGHSYFIQHYEYDPKGIKDVNQPIDFALRLEYEIKPILREYVKDGILKPSALKIIENLGK
ncbi:McrB family protein [Chryseobacterium camelliae]|uniref:McrB family protein n=1 Tax=Chryseobacterium camelliae TaxID=1265445 RepID=UPI0028611122|nr:AAA family ATPase [Chryseobacterium camelliae]MDR6514442.1 hypothetical protein [Chryseobacterium camelliae]